MRSTALLIILLIAISATPALAQTATRAEFEELCEIDAGRWIGDITWVSDSPEFGERGEKAIGHWEARMDIDGKVLVAKFHGGKGVSRGMRFYDPGRRQIRHVSVNSAGRVTDRIFWKEDGQWRTRSTATEPDGKKVVTDLRLVMSDGGEAHSWQGTETIDGKETDKLKDVWRRVSKPMGGLSKAIPRSDSEQREASPSSEGGANGALKGKTHLLYFIVAPPELVEEGDRIFRSHGPWMKATHYRDGEKALLSYSVSKAPEPSDLDSLDPAPTGNTLFILSEIYETKAGVADHMKQADSSWEELPDFVDWLRKCKLTGVHTARIVNSLW